MGYSNLSISIDTNKKASILQKISEIKQNLDFLVNLNAEERKNLRTIGAKRVGYVQDVLSVAKQNTQHIPPSIDIVEYEKDALLFEDLSELFLVLSTLLEGVENTMMAAGNEAITTSDKIYSILKAVSRGDANLNVVLKKIAKHFEKKRKPKNLNNNPSES